MNPELDHRDGPRDECGVFGVYAPGMDVARLAYFSLFALQHRGQESAGIVASNGEALISHRGMGHVADIFGHEILSRLKGRTIAIIGYGSQGHAHALNLRDSGLDVRVGLRNGSKNRARAESAGLRVRPVGKAVDEAELIMLLTPDTGQAGLYCTDILPHLTSGKTLLFAHGFNIRFGEIDPSDKEVDVIMVAPKGPGHLVRRQYEEGSGVPCLMAVHQDATGNAHDLGLSYGAAIGGADRNEVEASEQRRQGHLHLQQRQVAAGAHPRPGAERQMPDVGTDQQRG